MKLAPGHILAGKYRLEQPLAVGGMGSIWVARHLQLDVPVAMKFMEDGREASADGRARFEREARSAAALRNQHVVQVLDYGVEGEVPYLVMELLHGEDLGQRLTREHRLPLGAASRILGQAARGLRTAHEAGVVHRDLKPANIFLARVDDEEVVKILDFGIAKGAVGGPLGDATKTGELMGSPHYMSPEQVRGFRDLDPRSDLWSLSVIMFRALTGRLPFGGEQVGNVIAQILADPIPVATQVAADLPPLIDGFFARGFARDRDQRFQTAREMAEAFAAVVNAPADLSGSWAAVPASTLAQLVALGPSRSAAPTPAPVWGAPPMHRAPMASMTEVARPLDPTPHPASPAQPSFGEHAAPAAPSAGSTGGPVTQTTFPPVKTPPAWWGAATGAGAFAGVLLGIAVFLAQRSPPPPEPAASPTESPVPEAVPSEPVPTVDPAPTAIPAPSSAVSAAASGSASATATSTASASSAPTAAPVKAPPPPPKATPAATPAKPASGSKATPAASGKKKP